MPVNQMDLNKRPVRGAVRIEASSAAIWLTQAAESPALDTRNKCLHYYFYFINEELGLCYLRVPTWCPFRLQFYFNGHNRLARTENRPAWQ